MVRDGIYYGGALLLLGGLAAWLGGVWGALPLWALAAFVMYFFRDPERIVPAGDGIISPADGRVVDLRRIEMAGQPYWKLSIFLNVFNVHVNRAPIGGVITEQVYSKGRFRVASRAEASVENEQNTVTIQPSEASVGAVIFKQIAGAVARRIVFTKKVGDPVERGERVGLIKFGSRVDVFIPGGFTMSVAVGDRVRGGVTWLAQPSVAGLRSSENNRTLQRDTVEQLQSR